MMVRTLTALALLLVSPIAAAQDEGIPVTVQVMDAAGKPIATASIRHPEEEAKHRVNTETGEWTDQVLYMPNGDELLFTKGLVLEFEISASGYNNAHVKYEVRKRKNVVPVVLTEMALLTEDDEMEEPTTGFGRSVPID